MDDDDDGKEENEKIRKKKKKEEDGKNHSQASHEPSARSTSRATSHAGQ